MKKTIRKILILAAPLLLISEVCAQEKKAKPAAKNIDLLLEVFSLPLAEAAKHQRLLHQKKQTHAKFYQSLVQGLEEGSVKQEVLQAIRTRSGQKSAVEEILELIYPTEFAYPGVESPSARMRRERSRKEESSEGNLDSRQGMAVVPTSFDTKNTGWTLEIEANLREDGKLIDLRFAPQMITFLKRTQWGQGLSETEMPEFSVQRLTTGLTMKVGEPTFVGTMSLAPVLQKEGAPRVRFAFIMASVVQL